MSADRQLAYYHACGACSAKWFSPVTVRKCPACSSKQVLLEDAPRLAPWISWTDRPDADRNSRLDLPSLKTEER